MPSLKSVPVVASASEDEEEETEEKWENCLRQGKLSDAAAELDSDLKLRPVVWKSVDKIRRALSVFWHNKRFPDALKLLKNSKVSLFSSVPLLESLSVTLLGLGQASLALTCALAGLNLEKKKPSSASSSSLENLIRRLIKFHVVTDAEFSQKNHPTLEDLKEFITNFSADTFSPEDNGATEAALTDLPLLAHFEAASSGSDLLLERAKTSFGRKKWRHAIQCFTKLIQVCPSSASSATRNCYAYGLARAQVQNDENAKAVEGYKELLKDQKNPFIPAYYGLAQLYLKHKNLTAALDANKEGHKLHQDLADEARDSESLSCELEPAFPELGPGAVLTFLFDNQRKEIQSHPAPDGVCRNTSCPVPATFPYRREIFADDPGAKDGFYLVHCSMRCSFHLHKNCYKSVRETTPKKDLAGSDCITPDCFGKCVQIFLLKENGFKKEIASITVPLQGPAAVAAAAAAPTPAEPAKAAAAKSSEAAAAVPAASERANVKDEGTSKKERATSPEKSKKSEMETKPTKSSEEKPSAEKHPPPSCDPTVLKISKDTSNLKVTKDVERGMEAQAAAAAASYTTTTKVSDPKSSPSKSKSAADVSAVKKLAKAPSKPPPPQQPKKRLISHEYKTLEKNEFKILGRMRQQYPAWSEFSDPEPHSTVDDVHGSGIELKMNCEKTLRKISNALVTGGRRDRDQQQVWFSFFSC